MVGIAILLFVRVLFIYSCLWLCLPQHWSLVKLWVDMWSDMEPELMVLLQKSSEVLEQLYL